MMKRKFLTLSMIAGSLIFASCGDNKKEKEDASAPMQHEMHQENEQAFESEKGMAEFKDEESKKLYESYLAVKDALVKTDAEAAKSASAELTSVAENNEEIAEISQKMAETDDVNKQRELFSELTSTMEPVLRQAISAGKIYKQFCPMAFEGKGDYWYSDSDQIRNPYYGDKMLKCGRVEDTIM